MMIMTQIIKFNIVVYYKKKNVIKVNLFYLLKFNGQFVIKFIYKLK